MVFVLVSGGWGALSSWGQTQPAGDTPAGGAGGSLPLSRVSSSRARDAEGREVCRGKRQRLAARRRLCSSARGR